MNKETKRKEKAVPKLKLTDHERHRRFIDMAKEIGASEDSADFDKAFDKVTSTPADRHLRPGAKRVSS